MSSDRGQGITLEEIVAQLGGEVVGDARTQVRQVAPLDSAAADTISFVARGGFLNALTNTAASAVVLGAEHRNATSLPRIIADNPYLYFAKLTALLNPRRRPMPEVHATAVIAPDAWVDPSATIGPHVVIESGARVGAGTVIEAHCVVGERVEVGADCHLYAGTTIYHGCRMGDRVVLHSGAVIGADGFGLANDKGHWIKVPQIGAVVIGDDVEIGANTTIDRGALADTVIENGVKLDNQIQVAHNVQIGANTAIAACVGIAGSAKIGQRCMIGGAAGILGHLEIADDVQISAFTLVSKSIRSAGIYTGVVPFTAHGQWLKNAAQFKRLDAMAQRINALEQQLSELQHKRQP